MTFTVTELDAWWAVAIFLSLVVAAMAVYICCMAGELEKAKRACREAEDKVQAERERHDATRLQRKALEESCGKFYASIGKQCSEIDDLKDRLMLMRDLADTSISINETVPSWCSENS